MYHFTSKANVLFLLRCNALPYHIVYGVFPVTANDGDMYIYILVVEVLEFYDCRTNTGKHAWVPHP